MSSNIVILTDDNFESEVLNSELPVMVDFWAPWCGPCLRLAPLIEEFASQCGDKVKVCKLNVEDSSTAAQTYSIRNLPTLLFFKGGKETYRYVGSSVNLLKLKEYSGITNTSCLDGRNQYSKLEY